MPKINIKASNIANLTDARYFAAMLVDFLDFRLDLSHDDRLSPVEYHGIKAWVEGPTIVANVGKTPLSLPQRTYHLDTQHIPEDSLYQGALLAELSSQQKLFITAPNNEAYIRQLIEDIQPFGIDVSGGAEEKVGFKSYEELDVFFEHLEIYS